MTNESSVDDVFQFMQLRPMRPVDETPTIALDGETRLAVSLAHETTAARRISLANAALEGDAVQSLAELPLGPEIEAALATLRDASTATTAELEQRLHEAAVALGARFGEVRRKLSDTLLASLLATHGVPRDLPALEYAYRIYDLLNRRADPQGRPALLASYLEWPLLAPLPVRPERRSRPERTRSPRTVEPHAARASLADAIAELARSERSDLLVQPDEQGAPPARGVPFALTQAARAGLSPATRAVLEERGIDLEVTPLDVAVQALAGDSLEHLAPLKWPRPIIETDPDASLPPAPAHAVVRPAGLADLLVVKKQIKRYEAGEIAHVENVLIGEKKSRAHRTLERSEETFLSETEATRERETELQTADRFELNRETSKTIRQDQQISAGLSLSGKYGPTIEFSSSFQLDSATSAEEATRSSSRFAHDVVSRSLERLTERVRELQTRTLIRETEETNLHELANETAAHVRGVYQFLDKIYEAQVFNYGVREMFDFMVPEPASFLWYVEKNPTLDLHLPPPPEDLGALVPDASFIAESTALQLAATFGATDVEAPPPLYKLLTAGLRHGDENASEEDQPRSSQRVEIQVPAGYRPLRARIRGLAISDENPVIAVTIGSQHAVWQPRGNDRIPVSDGHTVSHQPALYLSLSTEPFELAAESKLGVSVLAWETNNYTLDIVIVVKRTAAELDRWRIATYKKLRAAYEDRVRQYEQTVEQLRSEAEARAERESQRPFGAPPAENQRTIRTELKKHCITIVTQQRYDAFDATRDDAPPYFDLVEAAEEGAYIRFFEQAFEWDQMQYVFYPYFWSRKAGWLDRFTKQDVDPEFLEFLRAGAARVVVPVRPGFETAVTHYLETGKIWSGEGAPPQINTPAYVSIIDEIRERTGAPLGEVPVGEPWEVRVPTALVRVRSDGSLPEWERVTSEPWRWRPVGQD